VDFVVCFGAPAREMDRPPFGFWQFDLDGGLPIGWRAAMAGAPSIRAALNADTADERVELQQGWLPLSLDYRATQRQLHGVLATWPARAVAEIESGGWKTLTRVAARGQTQGYPADWELARRTCAAPARRIFHAWREAARYDTWNISIGELAAPLTDVRHLAALGRDVRWLPPRLPLYYLADPFPYTHKGRDFLLVEEYGQPKRVRGRISRVDPLSGGSDVTPVIVRDSHMSYPSTFREGDDTLCSPEIHQEDGCVIYRLTHDGSWELLHHILRGHQIVDPTFFHHDGRWWLFCTEYRGRSGNLTLHAYHGTALGGPWTTHALDPLKSDLASARPGGRPFTIGGRLYRPAQDCSRTYGGAVNIMEVEVLTPAAFRETLALRLEPDPGSPYPDGRHHLVIDGTRVYSDGKRCRYDYLRWWKARG
jgi:hypothetical protein